jgi:phenylacetate-CoA ligase
MFFQEKLDRYRRKKVIRVLCNASPEKFKAAGTRKLPGIFRKALINSPAYLQIVSQHAPELLLEKKRNFRLSSLPVLSKEMYLDAFPLRMLAGKRTAGIKLAMTSSGYSGTFAYGFSNRKSPESIRFGVDTTFDYCFNISEKRTFLINCGPMGVHVETSMPIAEVSVRSDMAIALLKKVSPIYDQTVIIGDPYFMKKLVEEGDADGIKWKKLNVSLVTAQDWLPESLRSYLAARLEIDPDENDGRAILTTMGMTELGINVFHESHTLVKLRREYSRNPELRKRLTNLDMKAPPMFYHYYPFRHHIETILSEGYPELLFTSLSKDDIIPVIRYSTGDSGSILNYYELKEKLGSKYAGLLPDLKLPLGIIMGRTKNRYNVSDKVLHLEDIKEALFLDAKLAETITGLIKVSLNKETPLVDIHLKEKVKITPSLTRIAERDLSDFLQLPVEARLREYHDFPGALELCYEHKLHARE